MEESLLGINSILQNNGSGVIQGSFSSSLSFHDLTNGINDSKKELVIRFSLGKENLGSLKAELEKIKMRSSEFIVSEEELTFIFLFEKDTIFQVNFVLKFFDETCHFGEFFATKKY